MVSKIDKTCFVIIGYGKKMDYATGRELDLDKTFEYIIRPVFEELQFVCYRSIDIKHSGVIDKPMYDSILKADFVVADLSTLNPNVLYELGVRHAVRKNTTIIISEKHLPFPFDLSHIVVDQYEHLGKAIDFGEVNRFRQLLKDKAVELSSSPKTDSPLYTIFPGLEVPRFTKEEVEEIKDSIREDGSLSDIMTQAETAKNSEDYSAAIRLLEKAKFLRQDNILVLQRLALVTYKSKLPDAISALHNANFILQELNPDLSTNLETLGLSGAIHKRLFEATGEVDYLYKAIWYYEKGYYIGQDYYNGINLAFLFNVLANRQADKYEAYASYGNANRIRKNIVDICKKILLSKGWVERDDKEWVYLTLAEANFALGNPTEEEKMLQKAASLAQGDFASTSYRTQRNKLSKELSQFKQTYLS